MSAKRVLLVDEHRAVTSLLRSALESLGRGCISVEVPSGEEGLLEIGRGGADLVVVDQDLPGIGGLEMARRIRRLHPATRLILTSAALTPELEQDAAKLGVMAVLPKPIDPAAFLAIIEGDAADHPVELPAVEANTTGVAERLALLRQDLGADAVCLVDMQARVTLRAGDITRLNLDPVLAEVISSVAASLRVSRMLAGLVPANVHYFNGDEYDLYAANVGQFYGLVIVFQAGRGASQMGPVMRYGRQCADDLLNLLVIRAAADEVYAEAAPAPAAGSPLAQRPTAAAVARAAAPDLAAPPPARPARPLTEAELKALDEALARSRQQDANSFWDALDLEAGGQPANPDALSFEAAAELGLIADDL